VIARRKLEEIVGFCAILLFMHIARVFLVTIGVAMAAPAASARSTSNPTPAAAAMPATVTEREKFDAERVEKAQAQALAERAQDASEADLKLRQEASGKTPTDPFLVAAIVAIIGIFGNLAVAWYNGKEQRKLEGERATNSLDLEERKADEQRALEAQQAESDRILEVIKTGDSDAARRNMGFLLDAGLIRQPALVASLRTYLETHPATLGPALPPAGGGFVFQRDARLTETAEQQMRSSLDAYVQYLTAIGFPPSTEDMKVASINMWNAYFSPDENTLFIGSDLWNDPDVIRSEYTKSSLFKLRRLEPLHPIYIAILESLGEYFSCSFKGWPIVGERASLVIHGLDRRYLRTLSGPSTYDEFVQTEEPHDRGELWGRRCWSIRGAIGKEETDRLLFAAWNRCQWPDLPVPEDFAAPTREEIDAAMLAFTTALLDGVPEEKRKAEIAWLLSGYPLPAGIDPAPPAGVRSGTGLDF
jgi:hypothetical protein